MKPKLKISEKSLQKQIIDYLRLKKYLVVKFRSVGIFNQKTNHFIPVPELERGTADLLACSPEGQFIAIECKIGYNKPTEAQTEFIKQLNNRSGLGIIVWSLDEAIKNLK